MSKPKVLMDEAKIKAETLEAIKFESIEAAAKDVVGLIIRNKDYETGKIDALSIIIDHLANVSVPRTIAFLGESIDRAQPDRPMDAWECHSFSQFLKRRKQECIERLPTAPESIDASRPGGPFLPSKATAAPQVA